MLKDDKLLDRNTPDFTHVMLDPKRVAMLEYSEKLTLTPGAMESEDVAALRSAGFSDRDILDIAEVVGYYAYVNRIADGLGVAIETWMTPEE